MPFIVSVCVRTFCTFTDCVCLSVQRGDILLSINGTGLSARPHAEVIQAIKSMTSASTVRLELIQGEETESGLSPDWPYWMRKNECRRDECRRDSRWVCVHCCIFTLAVTRILALCDHSEVV